MIGTAHQAAYNLDNVSTENIVALCDVDDRFLADAAKRHPGAKAYNDFRRLLDQRGIDAVVAGPRPRRGRAQERAARLLRIAPDAHSVGMPGGHGSRAPAQVGHPIGTQPRLIGHSDLFRASDFGFRIWRASTRWYLPDRPGRR